MLKSKVLGKVLGLAIALVVFSSSSVPAMAAEKSDGFNAVPSKISSIEFKNLEKNPNQSYEGIDKDGNSYTVTIEEVTKSTVGTLAVGLTSTYRTWKVSYTGIVFNCSFYMDVSSNQVTNVYDKWILIVGGTFENATLSKTSTYGKLDFDAIAYGGLLAGTCWLKGTVTGSDNDITVSWSM